MNKQELINKIDGKKYVICVSDVNYGYNKGLDKAIELIKLYMPDSGKIDLDKIKESGFYIVTNNKNTPPHYQGTFQPIDLINAQDLNFNLGNVVKYVCRAGKKQGENILSDLEKAKDYINFEIERVKQ